MNTKIVVVGALLIAGLAMASAKIEFRDSSPVEFFTNVDLNGYTLTGVGGTQCGPSEALTGDGSCMAVGSSGASTYSDSLTENGYTLEYSVVSR